jgi:hypothetical protein
MDMPDDLSESERHLVANGRRGMAVDFRTDADDGPHEAERGPSVRAVVIAALVSDADSLSRFSLYGARISGDLDLAGARLRNTLLFEYCVFDGDLLLAEATTRSVRLRGCHLSHIDASRIALDGELEVAGCRLDSLSLYGARTGDVEISGSMFTSTSVGVQGDLVAIDGAFYCHDAVLNGQLRLPGARVKGYVELDGATIHGGVLARNLDVDNGMYCRLGFTADRAVCTVEGDLDLRGARIKRELRLDAARLTVLDLRQAQVDSLYDDPAHWPGEPGSTVCDTRTWRPDSPHRHDSTGFPAAGTATSPSPSNNSRPTTGESGTTRTRDGSCCTSSASAAGPSRHLVGCGA